MMAAPNRKKLLYSVVENDKSPDFAYKIMEKIVKSLDPIRNGLWKYYRE